jgi:antitoxin MazE
MITKVQKWGKSQGLRLTKEVHAHAHINIGDEVNIAVDDGVIVVAPVKRVRGKYRIEDIVSRIPSNYKAEEVDWGTPVGRETW